MTTIITNSGYPGTGAASTAALLSAKPKSANEMIACFAAGEGAQQAGSLQDKAARAAAQLPTINIALSLMNPNAGMQLTYADAMRTAQQTRAREIALRYPNGKSEKQLIAEAAEEKGLAERIYANSETMKKSFPTLTDEQAIAHIVLAILRR